MKKSNDYKKSRTYKFQRNLKRKNPKNFEDQPSFERMRDGLDYKDRFVYYKIIDRFFKKWIGKSFDKAYSEFCKRFPKKSKKNFLIHKEVDWTFNQEIYKENGKYYFTNRWSKHLYHGLLINEDRVIKYIPKQKKENRKKEIDYYPTKDPNCYYKKINGIWYLFEKTGKRIFYYYSECSYSYQIEEILKIQVSSQLLKKYNLKNYNTN